MDFNSFFSMSIKKPKHWTRLKTYINIIKYNNQIINSKILINIV